MLEDTPEKKNNSGMETLFPVQFWQWFGFCFLNFLSKQFLLCLWAL